MARKLAGVVFAVSTLHVSVVQALGLGAIELKSSLNQPLSAQIALLNTADIEQHQLSVRLAGKEAFEQAGVERTFFLNDMTFTVNFDGKGSGVITVASEKLVREPYLDFVLEARWPQGQMVREYTLLVDLPEMADGAVVASSPVSATNTAARIPGPVSTAAAATTGAVSGQLVTRRNDTLWEIAAKIKPTAVNMQQAMMAILQRNPDAFDDGNINSLRKGQVLHFPEDSEYRALTRDQAIAAVAQQNAAWRSGRAQPASGSDNSAATPRVAASADSYMKLSGAATATTASEGDAAAGAGAPIVQGESVVALQNKMTVAEERLDRAERENGEMNSRIGDLEQQIDTLIQLVALKDQQIASQQNVLSEGASAGAGDIVSAASPTESAAAAMAEQPSASGQVDGAVAGERPTESAQSKVTAGAVKTAARTATTMDQSFPVEAQPTALGEPVETVAATESDFSWMMWPAAGGIGLLLAGGGLIAHRRRRDEAAEVAAQDAVVAEEARASLKARAVGATAEAGTVVDAEALLADDDNSESWFTPPAELGGADLSSTLAVDPMAAAETYCNSGQHDQAIALLQQAIAAEPSRSELHLQLLSVLAEQGHEQAFKAAFNALERSGDQDTAFMARHLVADKGWLDGADSVASAAEGVGSTDIGALSGNDADAALEQGGSAGDEVFAFDLNFDADAAEASGLSQDGALELDLNLDGLDSASLGLDVDTLGEAFAESDLKLDLELSEPQLQDSTVDLGMNLDLNALGDASEPEGIEQLLSEGDTLDEEMQGMLDGDAISTKLDLARAYVDMGDADGARDILEEVLQEGSDGQKDEANQMLEVLAS
jgi:pilus assembly protein FimV